MKRRKGLNEKKEGVRKTDVEDGDGGAVGDERGYGRGKDTG